MKFGVWTNALEALESEKFQAEKDRVLQLVQGGPRNRVLPHAAGEDMEVIFGEKNRPVNVLWGCLLCVTDLRKTQ